MSVCGVSQYPLLMRPCATAEKLIYIPECCEFLASNFGKEGVGEVNDDDNYRLPSCTHGCGRTDSLPVDFIDWAGVS